jgi:DNA polymerase elongation subunit (family B)
MKKLMKKIKNNFYNTMVSVSEILGISPSELNRDDYVRVTVDCGIEGKLNKESLHALGGFTKLKDEFFPPVLTTPPKIKMLYLDIETAPIVGYVWGLWKNDLGLNQIVEDWSILSFAAKWADSDTVIYHDQRNTKNVRDDKEILKKIWKLLDEADVVVGQNSKQFDIKKINARFIKHGFLPPSSYTQLDTLQIAKRKFNFTSNKLAYLTDMLCTKYKKLDHSEFSGFELWKQCLAGNINAWKSMEKYNKYDVLSLQELHEKLAAWDSSFNPNLYHNSHETICQCGNKEFKPSGHHYSAAGKYQKYQCTKCGFEENIPMTK